jgi:hypothetical protein
MLDETNARAVAYQVLDKALADESIHPGARGAMFSVVDALRGSAAPTEDLRRAECISIGIHRLEWALQVRDENASRRALDELRALAADWLNARISGPLN